MNTLVILTTFCGLLLLIMVGLILLLVRVFQNQLTDQRVENQLLRNQIRSTTPSQLAGLNSVTLPSSNQPIITPDPLDTMGLDEGIDFEEQLARKGYMTGDVGYDLSAAGWSSPVLRREAGDGDPIAYDTTT